MANRTLMIEPMLGKVLRIVLSLVLVGILAFLYVMSQGSDLRRQAQIGSDLRSLKEVDTAWNRNIAAARSDPFSTEPPVERPATRLASVLENLTSETTPLLDRSLDVGVTGLRNAFVEKQNLIAQFEQANDQLRNTLKELLASLTALRQAASQLAATDAKLRPRLVGLDSQLSALSAQLTRVYLQPDDVSRKAVNDATTLLAQSADQYPESLRTPLSGLGQSVGLLLQQEPGVTQIANQIELLPTSPRISSTNAAYDRAFQASAEQKEQFRVYLVFYSAALLVFLGYVVWQLGRSYVKINQTNDALTAANEGLEQRVQDRTKELSNALRHLKESELMLIQTEKMSSLGQMVAGIVHEINTPLAYLKSSLSSVKERLPLIENIGAECHRLIEMLERGDAPDETLSAQFAKVSTMMAAFRAESSDGELTQLAVDGLHGIDQISEIILNLKNFSRLDRSKLQRFNLNEGIESTLVIARNMVKHKTLNRRLAEIPLVECSPSQINQVFLNLITNAAQATGDAQGELTIATSPSANGEVRVDVSDNGHGIAKDVLPKIFDPFFTTKDVGQGTGLGLAIAYKIVQEHGGRILVNSVVGKGTTFSVFLPVKAGTPQALAA